MASPNSLPYTLHSYTYTLLPLYAFPSLITVLVFLPAFKPSYHCVLAFFSVAAYPIHPYTPIYPYSPWQNMLAGGTSPLLAGIAPSRALPVVDLNVPVPVPVPVPVAPSAPTAPSTTTATTTTGAERDGERVVKETENLYTKYSPKLPGSAHPSDLITTSTLDFALPTLDAEAVHPNVMAKDALSAAQLDTICLTRMAHLKGKAILIGDGTGVGKGRELAGVMLNHLKWQPKCRKYVIVTASAQLEHDFRRDLIALGWPLKGSSKKRLPLFAQSSFDAKKKITGCGILFTTYSMLRTDSSIKGKGKGKGKANVKSRLDQVLDWLNEQTDTTPPCGGVIAFDEIHSAKGDPKKVATSQAVIDLQAQAPDFDVVYASATAMSDVAHLSALTRLRLWDTEPYNPTAIQTAYGSRDAFLKKWKTSTRSGLEVVSSELAAQGLYIARRLSFEGTAFRTSIANMTPEQVDLHTRLSAWWMRLGRIEGIFPGKQMKARLWLGHLSFFKALLVAFRVDHCTERAKLALDAGGSIVVSLIGTGEAAAKRAIEEKGEEAMEDGFVALKELMVNIVAYGKLDSDGKTPLAIIPPELAELEAQLATFDQLPPSPLDLLIHKLGKLGYGKVAEMTGRDGGFECDDDGKWSYTRRSKKGADSNLSVCERFQAGTARIAVISSAASTGYAATLNASLDPIIIFTDALFASYCSQDLPPQYRQIHGPPAHPVSDRAPVGRSASHAAARPHTPLGSA